MSHLSQEQLVLYYYGESDAAPAAQTHLDECPECRAAYGELQRLLNSMDAMPTPERSETYSGVVWRRLEHQVGFPKKSRWLDSPRWVSIGVLGALVAGAFLAGRWTGGPAPQPATPPVAAQQQAHIREGALLVALGEHLEQSQRVLVEISNDEGAGWSGQQKQAKDLIAANRLYRQSAVRDRDAGVASLLDDLERVLLDVAHASESERRAIVERMAEQGILFKVRVVESNVRQRERERVPVMRY